MRHRGLRGLLIAAVVCSLAACASYGPGGIAAGESADTVVQRMGPPTARHALPDGGTRLEFARGPFGRDTYMIDVDASQRVTRVRQVLDERTFEALPLGLSREEVRAQIGTPSNTMRIARQNLDIWSYRYFSNFCQWFQVSMDISTGKMVEKGYGPDPMCDFPDGPQALMLRPVHR
jgi:hypothetical protein